MSSKNTAHKREKALALDAHSFRLPQPFPVKLVALLCFNDFLTDSNICRSSAMIRRIIEQPHFHSHNDTPVLSN